MICTAITTEAYDAIAATLALGTVASLKEAFINATGEGLARPLFLSRWIRFGSNSIPNATARRIATIQRHGNLLSTVYRGLNIWRLQYEHHHSACGWTCVPRNSKRSRQS